MHELDIVKGKATVKWSPFKKAWVIPSGRLVKNEKQAIRAANIMNRLMRGEK